MTSKTAMSRWNACLGLLALVACVACGGGADGPPLSSRCDDASAGGSANLALRNLQQHSVVWCWAAVSSSVTDYLRGVMGEDCHFLSAYFYSLADLNQCCAVPQACERPALSMQEIQVALYNVGGVVSRLANEPLSEADIKHEIANGRPIIAGLTSSFSGHVILIVGYDGSVYHVQDPFFGESYGVSYSQLLNNAQTGSWTSTLYRLSRTEERCV